MNDVNPLGVPAHRHWPDQRDPVLAAELNEQRRQSYNAETLRTRARGEGTRQRPGGWVDGIGWVVRSTDLRPGDKDEAAWVVRPGEVGSPFYSLAVVTRWADGTSPAPPAPLTRPDLAEKWRGEADNQRVTHTLGAVAQAQTLRRCADELDAQPAPLTPTPQPDGRWVEAIWHILVTEGGANAEDRDAFIAQWPDCVEYRFGGHLGSGGKVWAPGSKRSVPVVDFYPESSTVSRRAIAARINVHLCDAYVMAIALGSAAPPPTPVERPAAITDEMLRAAETHHGDSCSYCTSTGDIDCPTAAVLDALAAATSPAPGDNP